MRLREIHIGPKKAQMMMAKMAPNRHLSEAIVTKYANDMRAGFWRLTHEAIAFDTKGRLIDGQHRLAAIIKSGVTIIFLVMEGCDPKSIRNVNTGRVRTVGNQLEILGIKAGNRLAGISRNMLAGLRHPLTSITNESQIRCAKKYGDDIRWVVDAAGKNLRRTPAYAVVVKAVIMEGRGKLEPFCNSIRDNIFPQSYSPANQLFMWLHRPASSTAGVKRADVYGKTVAAVRLFLAGRVSKNRLTRSNTDIGLDDLLSEFMSVEDIAD